MAFIDFAKKEIACKVVYYGPLASGKTSNLRYIHQKTSSTPPSTIRDGSSQNYDYLPMSLGEIRGYATEIHLFTVPGAPQLSAGRLLVLKNVDGVVFVADSDRSKLAANQASVAELDAHLTALGYSLAKLPRVLQLNKRDSPTAVSADELSSALGIASADGNAIEAVATTGVGVFETLKVVTKLVLAELKRP